MVIPFFKVPSLRKMYVLIAALIEFKTKYSTNKTETNNQKRVHYNPDVYLIWNTAGHTSIH